MTANTPLSSPRRGVNLLHNHHEVEAQRARSILKMEDEESENHLGSIFNNENESFDDDDDDDDDDEEEEEEEGNEGVVLSTESK
mmetsp:Transcript_36906/g.54057  ORF Transcript_36906/g.54057 Transcript_36906/m.54057 type:complete len:84 (-) Transcript_36906:466-717(-)